jgi:hypothetical protein
MEADSYTQIVHAHGLDRYVLRFDRVSRPMVPVLLERWVDCPELNFDAYDRQVMLRAMFAERGSLDGHPAFDAGMEP